MGHGHIVAKSGLRDPADRDTRTAADLIGVIRRSGDAIRDFPDPYERIG